MYDSGLALLDVVLTPFIFFVFFVYFVSLFVSQGHYYDQIPGGYSNAETRAIYESLKDVLCIPTMVGSHFEATSTK